MDLLNNTTLQNKAQESASNSADKLQTMTTNSTPGPLTTEQTAIEGELKIGSFVERSTRVSLTIRVVPVIMREDASPATQAEKEELRRIENHW